MRPGASSVPPDDDATRNATAAAWLKPKLNYTLPSLSSPEMNESFSVDWSNRTLLGELPNLVNQTLIELITNLTNATDPHQPGTNEEPSKGFFAALRAFFKTVTSIDRYTLILTCAFIFGVVLIGVLILIAICVCKKFNNQTPKKGAKSEKLELGSPASAKKNKAKSKLDFLEESKSFLETNVDAPVAAVAIATEEDEEEEGGGENKKLVSGSPTVVKDSETSKTPGGEQAAKQLPSQSPSKMSSLANIAASLSSLTGGGKTTPIGGGYSKNLKGGDNGSAQSTSARRQSIISSKLSKRASAAGGIDSTSQVSLGPRAPIYFDGVDRDIDELIQPSADLPNADKLRTGASTRTLNKEPGTPTGLKSIGNSLSDIYRKALDEKRKLKKTKSNGQMGPNDVSYNPGNNTNTADGDLSICDSEQSCY